MVSSDYTQIPRKKFLIAVFYFHSRVDLRVLFRRFGSLIFSGLIDRDYLGWEGDVLLNRNSPAFTINLVSRRAVQFVCARAFFPQPLPIAVFSGAIINFSQYWIEIAAGMKIATINVDSPRSIALSNRDVIRTMRNKKEKEVGMFPAQKINFANQERMKKIILLTLIGLSLLALPALAQTNLLHEFAGGPADGANPSGSLIISDTTFYGTTGFGGVNGLGTIFKMETDGSGFVLLHEFAGGAEDGAYPVGSLIISGATLYGTTLNGGSSDFGTIFKIQTDGNGYTLLHEFAGGTVDGANPYGSLLLSDTTLYGMTGFGGESDYGTIFKVQADGSNFTLLHDFTGGIVDGRYPRGSLLLDGSTLYGMTHGIGDIYKGMIFALQTDGSGFTLLHKFTGGAGDGAQPFGSLILSGSSLYGMTYQGGGNESGTIFNMQTDGSGFNLLHEFAGGVADGAEPRGSLILSGSTLYGMSYYGGDSAGGTVFAIETNGEGLNLLHEFAGGIDDGAFPRGDLLFSGSTLYGMTISGGDSDVGVIFSLPLPGILVTSPNGGENWNSGTIHPIHWTSTGTIVNVNIDYSTNSGSFWISVTANAVNNGSYAWTVPATPSADCLVRVSDAADANRFDVSNRVFSISQSGAETISTPRQPSGAASGLKNTGYFFSSGGSASNLGHAVQYKIDWDDGTDSGWLAEGTTRVSHRWAVNGTYDVRAMARCVMHTTIESLWSETQAIIISDSGTLYYNSPAQRKILPEVIWAPATGSGTWMSEVQITDISGGSQVSVYYSTSAGRRGPFPLWNNSGGALCSQKYSNILQSIDSLDSGVFTYFGTVGAVEFFTQDAAHVLQVAARTLNDGYSKTFPGLSLHDDNTADTSRAMSILNLTNNSAYRSTCGMFNPTADAVTMELRLFDAGNTQIGSTITKTLSWHGFKAFNPFNEAGVPYPANSFDNVILQVQPIAGTGKVLCFGASANNGSNDPAAHLAVQNSVVHDNGPSCKQILPEAIWAAATGGGTWMSELQLVDVTGGSAVSVTFHYGGGSRRGPFALWTGSGAGAKVKYANILGQMGTGDGGFTYYGQVGTLEFQTQDDLHHIQVVTRTLNNNNSKTFPGLNLVDAETADTSRVMLIQNYASNGTYRSTCGFFNPTADAVTVEFTLLNASGAQIGVTFSRTFGGYDYQAFFPFSEAGVSFPANTYDNAILRVRPTSGAGRVVCFGASANNASNDPAAHIAVQGQ